MKRSIVELRLPDGEGLTTWQSVRIRESFTDPLGSYEFTFAPPPGRRSELRRKLVKGTKVELYIDGARQAAPILTTVKGTLGRDGYRMHLSAKSLLCTPYEGSVDPYVGVNLNAETPVAEVVLRALAPYGFTSLGSDASAMVSALTGKQVQGRGAAIDVEAIKHKDAQAQPGETGYAWPARIFNRTGGALHVDHDGGLILRRPDYEQAPIATLVESSDLSRPGDHMELDPEIEVTATNDGQFSEYVVSGQDVEKIGQKNITAPEGGVKVPGATRPTDAAFQKVQLKELAPGRHNYSAPDAPFKPRYRLDKKARDKARCETMAELMAGLAAANAWQLRCGVVGFVSTTGAIWTVDTVVQVFSETHEIDEPLWVLELEKSFNEKSKGQRTTLTLIPLGALTLGELG